MPKILGIVVGALVLVIVIGGAVAWLSGGRRETPAVTVPPPPATTTPPDSSPPPTPDPGQKPPAGDPVEVGDGVSVTPAAGWRVLSTDGGIVQLTDGSAVFVATTTATIGLDAAELLKAYNSGFTEVGTGVKQSEIKTETVGPLDVATSTLEMTVSQAGGSQQVSAANLVSVNPSKDKAAVASVLWPSGVDDAGVLKDYADMTGSMLQTHAA